MNRQLAYVLAMVCVLASCTKTEEEDLRGIQPSVPSAFTLQQVIDKYRTEYPELPAITAAIITSDNRIYTAASGYADVKTKARMTPFHKIGVGSNTKMLTSVIILQLMEEGKLKLNDRISEYLSEPWVDSLNAANGFLAGRYVRIIDLLKHTSGIYDYVDANFVASTVYYPEKNYTIQDLMHYTIYTAPAHFLPGTPGAFNYSSTNFTLLGLIIEHITGKKFEQVLHERILNPAQMNSSFLFTYEPVKAPLADGYHGLIDISGDNLSWVWATGGLASNYADMFRFLNSLMNGKFFKKQETLSLMTQFTEESLDEYGYQYGLGIMKFDFGNRFDAVGHIGSLHGYTSACFYLPEQKSYMYLGVTTGGAHHYLFDLLGRMYTFQTKRSLPFPRIPRLGGRFHQLF
jgi:D-alanyl-D-alanine carboxypeptidase